MESKKLIVGIDFGTSTTVVRYRVEGSKDIHSIKDTDGLSDTIPSVIFRTKDGVCLYGIEAQRSRESGADGEFIQNFKIGLLAPNEEERKTKREYIKEFLEFVYKLFKEQTRGLNTENGDVYVSYPAKWDFASADFMEHAVHEAGFSGKIHGAKEPNAAVADSLHTSLKSFIRNNIFKENEEINVLMLDMGAGTSDIVIFSLRVDQQGKPIIEKPFPYPTVDNPNLCGGSEIDEILSKHVTHFVENVTNNKFEDFDIYAAKHWKDQNLSNALKSGNEAKIPPALLALATFFKKINTFSLNRDEFEKLTKNHWEKLYALISFAVNTYKSKFGIGAEDIDLLLLTGGHSKWYTVTNLFNGEGVAGYIGKEDYKIDNTTIKALNFSKLKDELWRISPNSLPHECVAKGLCILDDTIEFHSIAPNNVWAKITIDGVSSDNFKVVDIGDNLPFISKKLSFDQTYTRNLTFGNCNFDISIDLYTGETLENAKHSVMTFNHDDNTIVGSIFVFLLSLGFSSFMSIEYKFEVSMVVEMRENGTLDLNGKITVSKDGKKMSNDFTLDKFHVI